MRIGCGEACACLTSCVDYAAQTFAATLLTCDKIIRDPETFQKTCILAHSILVGFNLWNGSNHSLKLIEVLDIAQSFDFYGFCRIPRYLFHSFTAARIDEEALLDALEVLLCEQWDIGSADVEGQARDPELKEFAKGQLQVFLSQMVEDDIVFRTEEEMRTALKNWFFLALKVVKAEYDPDIIDLSNLTIPLKPTPFLEVMADISFIVVDIGCIPDFLQQWEIIDLSHFANRLYSLPVFSLLPQRSLDEYVRGMLCVGFSLQFLDALQQLTQSDLSADNAANAKWLLAASASEFVYNMAILQKGDMRWITIFAFAAKLIGITRFLVEPAPTFYTDP